MGEVLGDGWGDRQALLTAHIPQVWIETRRVAQDAPAMGRPRQHFFAELAFSPVEEQALRRTTRSQVGLVGSAPANEAYTLPGSLLGTLPIIATPRRHEYRTARRVM